MPPQRVVAAEEIPALIEGLVDRVRHQAARYILGITGPPGAGKTSLAVEIVEAASAVVEAQTAPMDGFHRSNAELTTLGLLPLKGIPDTFDAAEFAAHVEQLRRSVDVRWPGFDRSRETVTAGHVIPAAARLVVVEGNYLLLDTPPWDRIRPLLDEVWFLDLPDATMLRRLRARHERARAPDDAWGKIQSTDVPNAALIRDGSRRADVLITVR